MRCDDVFIALEDSDQYESFRDIGLYCTRWDFPPAQPRVSTIPVTGGDGVFDVSESVRGDIGFDNVSGTLKIVAFRANPGAKFEAAGVYDHSSFCQKYHGKRVKLKASFDPDHYRIGRMWISEDGQQAVLRNFTITMDAEPFRYADDEKKISFASINETVTTRLKVADSRELFYDDLSYDYQELNRIEFRHSPLYDYPFPYIYVLMQIEPRKNYIVDYELIDRNFFKPIEPELWLYKDGHRTKKVEKTFYSEDCDTLCFYWSINWWNTNHVTYYGIENIVLAVPAPHDVLNEGRQLVIPTITSDVDCIVVSGKYTMQIYANTPTLAWDFPLHYGSNQCASLSSQIGNVEIKFREGFL